MLSNLIPESFTDDEADAVTRAHRLVSCITQKDSDELWLGTPTDHALRVANTVAGVPELMRPEVVCAALLHDVLGAGAIGWGELAQFFSERVAALVDLVTVPSEGDGATERDRRFRARLALSPRAAQAIHLADILDTLRQMPNHPDPTFRARIARDCGQHSLPLAWQTGLFADEISVALGVS